MLKLDIISTTNICGVILYNFELIDDLTSKVWKFEVRYSEIYKFYKKIKDNLPKLKYFKII